MDLVKTNNGNYVAINEEDFSEVEELLNDEIEKTLSILKKSPMFVGRVTLSIVISDKGKTIRPILYKTKYTPKESNSTDNNIAGQMVFE